MRQLDRRLHLHVGLEDAAAERCLVVGLLRLAKLVLTAVFIRLSGSVTFVEMVRGRPTVQRFVKSEPESLFTDHMELQA